MLAHGRSARIRTADRCTVTGGLVSTGKPTFRPDERPFPAPWSGFLDVLTHPVSRTVSSWGFEPVAGKPYGKAVRSSAFAWGLPSTSPCSLRLLAFGPVLLAQSLAFHQRWSVP